MITFPKNTRQDMHKKVHDQDSVQYIWGWYNKNEDVARCHLVQHADTEFFEGFYVIQHVLYRMKFFECYHNSKLNKQTQSNWSFILKKDSIFFFYLYNSYEHEQIKSENRSMVLIFFCHHQPTRKKWFRHFQQCHYLKKCPSKTTL